MHKTLLTFALLLVAMMGAAAPKAVPNVVIEQLTDYYKLVPDKHGNLEKVEYTSQVMFRANPAAEKALLLAFYNDDIRIDKASGDATSYGASRQVGTDGYFDGNEKM